MNISYHSWESLLLGQKAEIKVYGEKGRPVLVFPSAKGRFFDYENFGMIDALSEYINGKNLIVFTVDGIDWQTWFNENVTPDEKAKRHSDYDKFIYDEVIQFIQTYEGLSEQDTENIIATGCDFGAYHAANFFFRHPDVINGLIGLSGVYSLKQYVGNYIDDNVYFNDPLLYLPNLKDPWYIDKFNDSDIIICSGQGAFEDWSIEQSKALDTVLSNIGVRSHWLDLWGLDVTHDWYWWRKEIVYLLTKLKRHPIFT